MTLRVHLDHLSPAAQSVSSCPLCPASFTNPTLLQTHFNSVHPDTFTPSPASSPVDACPVCGDTGWSVDQLQLHVESHFTASVSSREESESERLAREMETKERAKRKREEEAEFASLQAQYGMDEQGNSKSCRPVYLAMLLSVANSQWWITTSAVLDSLKARRVELTTAVL